MNLKLVVASMSVLGLVSCPVFAADATTTTTTTTTATADSSMTPAPAVTHHAKHKHHHKVRHHVAPAPVAAEPMPVAANYKDMGALCTISQTTMIMEASTQNIGRSLPNPCNPGWFNRIQVSGGLNVDFGKWGNRNQNYMGENYQRISLNDAYLNIAATVNDWARAFVSISYNTATINAPLAFAPFPATPVNAEYSAAYANNVTAGGANLVQIEQAYATFGNFDVSPLFFEVGKEFQDFSRYEIHPITRSLTQVMSETLATSAKLGFIVPMGFHGSLFVFDDPLAKVTQVPKTTNYGVALGYDAPGDQFGWDIGASYLYNMIGVNDVAYEVNQNNLVSAAAVAGYNNRVGATALYADVNSGPFSLGARYTTALQRFNCGTLIGGAASCDLPEYGNPLIAAFAKNPLVGAKPWAAGITGGYGFEGWGRNQNVYLGYQASRQAAALNLPQSRWMVGYGIEAFGKNTDVGIEWDHDMAYNITHGGFNNNTNLVSIRTSVKFG